MVTRHERSHEYPNVVVVHDLPSVANVDTDFEFCEIQSPTFSMA